MKLESTKEKLLPLLLLASRIAGKKLALPVLSCVLLEVKEGVLTVRATNLDLGIEMKLPIRGAQNGMVAVSSEILTAFISNLRQESLIVMESEDGKLVVTTPQSKTTIKTLNKDDFPTIPKVSSEEVFTLESDELIRGFKAVWQSASVSSMKPELSSVYLYPDSEKMVFVATDSFRLAEKRVKVKKLKQFSPLLIPFKNVVELIRVLECTKGEVEVHASNNQLAILFENIYVTSRIVEGTFPDYKQIIPKEFSTETIALKQDVVNALKTAHLFSDTFHQIKINVDPKKKSFLFITKNNDIGETIENIQATIEGDPIEIGFNYKYIADAMPSLETDSVSFSFNGASKPLVLKGVSDPGFTYLVMPMNK